MMDPKTGRPPRFLRTHDAETRRRDSSLPTMPVPVDTKSISPVAHCPQTPAPRTPRSHR